MLPLQNEHCPYSVNHCCCCMQAAVDAFNYVEEALALAPLFDEEAMRRLRPAPEAEPGQAPVKRRLSYTDEQQGVLPSNTMR